MKNQKNNPAMNIKCKFSNAIHKILEPNIEVKKSDRWKTPYQEKYKFTDSQKIEMFNKIFKIHQESSLELTNYKGKRSYKKRIQKLRDERGYVPKVKNKKVLEEIK